MATGTTYCVPARTVVERSRYSRAGPKEQAIKVYGYTDNVGTPENNLQLSQKRADAVRDYLVTKGLPKDLVTSDGKGTNDAVADNSSVEGRAQNRRVEIIVSPKK